MNFIIFIGLLIFAALTVYSIKLVIKKEEKAKLKKSFAGAAIGLVLIIVGFSIGGTKKGDSTTPASTQTSIQNSNKNAQSKTETNKNTQTQSGINKDTEAKAGENTYKNKNKNVPPKPEEMQPGPKNNVQ